MARKKRLPPARHPADAMVKFDRLLAGMAPVVVAPTQPSPKILKPRGKKKTKPS
ncbi:MAG: hypothetical protein ABL973_16645 [Micropepsaceae bacterium]